MPREKRSGVGTLYVELSEDLGQHLEVLAERNRRTLKGEVVIALERHLAREGVAGEEPTPKKPARTRAPRPRGG
jgi:hypothetical protein